MLRVLDGFEMHSAATNIPAVGSIRFKPLAAYASYYPSFTTSATRYSKGQKMVSGSLFKTTSATPLNNPGIFYNVPLPTVARTLYVGMAINVPSLAQVGYPIYSLVAEQGTAGACIWSLYVNQNGALVVAGPSGTILASSANGVIVAGTWTFIDAEIQNTNSGFDNITCLIYVAGVLVVNAGYQTSSSAVVPGTAICLGAGYALYTGSSTPAFCIGGSIAYDDLYIADGTGTGIKARVGDTHVETLFPSAEAENITNWTKVGSSTVSGVLGSAASPSDDTGSYYAGTSVGDHLLLSTTDQLAGNSNQILAVTVTQLCGRGDGTPTRAMATVLGEGVGGSETTGQNYVLQPLFGYAPSDAYTTVPSTGVAFTRSDVMGLFFGTKITA